MTISYRLLKLPEGKLGLYRVYDGIVAEEPLLKGSVADVEAEIGIAPGTWRKLARQLKLKGTRGQ